MRVKVGWGMGHRRGCPDPEMPSLEGAAQLQPTDYPSPQTTPTRQVLKTPCLWVMVSPSVCRTLPTAGKHLEQLLIGRL